MKDGDYSLSSCKVKPSYVGLTLTRLAALGTLSRNAGEGGPARKGWWVRALPGYSAAAARLARLRSLGSSSRLRSRIDFGVTSTSSSSAI
jgi:hypothetical protein